MLKLELTPQEGSMLIAAAERYLRDLRLEMPDLEDIETMTLKGSHEFDRTFRNKETFITGLLRRLRA